MMSPMPCGIHTENDIMNTKIDWFEIPSSDFKRATKFYEALFQTELRVEQTGPVKMAIFNDPNGESCGCVAHAEQYQPGPNGIVIYLDASPSIDAVIARIEPNGGKIQMPKLELPNDIGFIAHFIDPEGNRLGLHAMA